MDHDPHILDWERLGRHQLHDLSLDREPISNLAIRRFLPEPTPNAPLADTHLSRDQR